MKQDTTRYTYGARDPEARHARAVYNKLNERQRLLNGPQLVPSQPVINACRYAIEAGVTRQELAARASMSDAQLSRLMRGLYPRMRLLNRQRLLHALKALLAEQSERIAVAEDSLVYLSVSHPGYVDRPTREVAL